MRDEMIRMAREAGQCCNRLVTLMQAQGYTTGHGDTMEDLLKELVWQVRVREREACARITETSPDRYHAAAAIRARGQA